MKRRKQPPARAGRRRVALGAALGGGALLLGLGGLRWLQQRAGDREREAVAVDRTGPAGRQVPPPWRAPPSSPELPPPVAGPKGEAIFRPLGGTPAAPPSGGDPARDLLTNRYGGRSGRLPPDRQPAPAEPRAETSSTDKRPELTVWLPSLRATTAGTTLHARVEGGGGTLASVQAEVALAAGATEVAPQSFAPMPPTGNAAGHTAEFAFRYVPDPADLAAGAPGAGGRPAPPTPVRYLVQVSGTLDGARFRRAAGGIFYVHRPGGHLRTETAQVLREEGDLRVHVDAIIERPGTYFVYAELWGGKDGDRPIAFARERLPDLPRGTRQLSLLFGGGIVKESGVDGPYLVRNLRFQQVDTHPAHESDPLPSLPPTPAFRAGDFH